MTSNTSASPTAADIATQLLLQLNAQPERPLTVADFAPAFMDTLKSMVDGSLDAKLAPLSKQVQTLSAHVATLTSPAAPPAPAPAFVPFGNTGVGDWTVDGKPAVVCDKNPAYVEPQGGLWISLNASGLGPAGANVYETKFDSIASETALSLLIAADDAVTHIVLDGVDLFVPDNLGFTAFSSVWSALTPGAHTLQVTVTNADNHEPSNPTGICVLRA